MRSGFTDHPRDHSHLNHRALHCSRKALRGLDIHGALMPVFFGLDRHWVLFVGICAVVGHCFSIFLKFRGGKAVATSAGILLAYNPLLFVICFICLASIVYITSMVSVASLTTVLIFAVATLFLHDWILTTVAVIVTVIVYIRHIPNIKRLIKGKENLVPIGLRYKKQQESKNK